MAANEKKSTTCCGSVEGCDGSKCQDPQVRALVSALTAPSWLTHGIEPEPKGKCDGRCGRDA